MAIVRTTELHLALDLEPHQLAAHQAEKRFQVNVWHRRAGKTYYVVGKMVINALMTNRPNWRAFYLAPTFKAAKAISWDYLKAFTRDIPGRKVNESELRVDLPNGARIQLLGTEGYEALRGRYADEIAIDETAQVPGAAWFQVLSPMLADREGRATFIGTPQGNQNLFRELWDYAGGDDALWGRSLLTWRDTDMIKPGELDRMRRSMRQEEFEQELECSWNSVMRGAYYGKLISDCENENRITTVKYDRTLPVTVAVDLGWSDAMVCTFWQQGGTEHRCILAKAYEQTAIPDMVHDWRGLGFPIDNVILPHDARAHELGTGLSREEVFHSLGCNASIAPNLRIHEGISQVRDILPNAWFDRDGCKALLEALRHYRSKFDEVRQVHSVTPEHDWSSHWADSLRYYAVGRLATAGGWSDNSHLYDELNRGII